jgi:hypothetical protein
MRHLSNFLDASARRGVASPRAVRSWPSLVGYLAVGLFFSPDTVRGFVYAEFVQAGTEDYDVRLGQRPLDGKFPIED